MAPNPVFLPGEFHGQRSLVGYSSRGCRESDMTEQESSEWKGEMPKEWDTGDFCLAPSYLLEPEMKIETDS